MTVTGRILRVIVLENKSKSNKATASSECCVSVMPSTFTGCVSNHIILEVHLPEVHFVHSALVSSFFTSAMFEMQHALQDYFHVPIGGVASGTNPCSNQSPNEQNRPCTLKRMCPKTYHYLFSHQKTITQVIWPWNVEGHVCVALTVLGAKLFYLSFIYIFVKMTRISS